MIRPAPGAPSDALAAPAAERSLSVLMCVRPSSELGGLETSFGRIIGDLQRSGVSAQSAVIGPDAANSATARYLSTVMPVHTPVGMRAAMTLIRGFDVVHVHCPSGTTAWPATILCAARLAGVPLIITLHLPGVPELRPRLRGRIKARVLGAPRQLLLAVTGALVVCPSSAAADLARSRFAPLRVPIRAVWNGVPDSGHVPVSTAGPLRLVFVGRLSPHKRPLEFVEAVEIALDQGVDVVADVVGDGPLGPDVRRRVAASAHADRITVHGALPDVTRVLRQGHVLVLMSRHEGGPPLVLMEAGATGRGTVARAGVEGVSDDWPESVALVDRESDAAAFAQLFCNLAADFSRVTTLGAAARARYEDFFTAEKSAGRLRAAYLCVIGDRGPRQ